MSYVQHTVTIRGDVIIMHNGQTADPQNKYAKTMKAISSNRKKTDADLDKLAQVEYEASLYTDKKENIILPSKVIEATIAEGAKVSKSGKSALSGVYVDSDGTFKTNGKSLTMDEVLATDDYKFKESVRIQKNRIMRTRAKFENWESTFTVSREDSIVSESDLKRWIQDAGSVKGMCDWRPRHGRFELVSMK